jgi:DNA (cytosine-5)-methyltransferase 1
MKVLDLFSGIGGFSLGLERAGFETVAFCEVDKKCQAVLKKHWPNVPIFDDVSNLKGEDIGQKVDVICGGFPCQDISLAGKGAGLAGKRSGLWSEFHRLIKEIKPKYAIIENVSALRSRGLDQVLREISEIGYDAEWHCITAASIGAPHRRDRIWIVAYSRDNTRRDSITGSLGRNGEGQLEERVRASETTETSGSSETSESVAYSQGKLSDGNNTYSESSKPSAQKLGSSSSERNVSNSNSEGLQGQWEITSRISKELQDASYSCWWKTEPSVGRVANGIPGRVDRLKQLGNAVVPQIPQLLGMAIMEREKCLRG